MPTAGAHDQALVEHRLICLNAADILESSMDGGQVAKALGRNTFQRSVPEQPGKARTPRPPHPPLALSSSYIYTAGPEAAVVTLVMATPWNTKSRA